ncbi:hypothetical protein [Chondromyces crocatus]|uniref:Uncharacterized protein n=1 Tax=Chondromyces crocatus TaxID=52 RepID=A0A0K1EAN8_CHOCO|nr:hypothetical protein [Chondromyces crocatus]AKT37742.1 uncharacterized protein CMC5_018840 [Chondromyces crocatus]
MSHDDAHGFGERIVAFLRDALTARVPERDRPLGHAIRSEMATAVGDIREESEWEAWKTSLLSPIVAAFSDVPERWDDVVDLLAIYIFRRGVSTHQTVESKQPSAVHMSQRTVGHELIKPLLLELLQSTPGHRVRFFEKTASWNVLHALAALLPELDLGDIELLKLIQNIVAIPAHNIGRGELIQAVSSWITNHPETGQRIVDASFGREEWIDGLTPSALLILIEGVCRADASRLPWRDGVIQRLMQEPDERLWGIVVRLAYSAWPTPTPIRVRFDAVVEAVRRLRTGPIDDGLLAVAQGAREHPSEAIATAAALLDLVGLPSQWPSAVTQRRATLIANIAEQVASGACLHAQGGGCSLPELTPLLPALLSIDLSGAQQALDGLFDTLVPHHSDLVKTLVAAWLAAHRHTVVKESFPFEEIFPCLAHQLGKEGITRWLLEFLVAPHGKIRGAAAYLLGLLGEKRIPPGALDGLSAAQVDAMAHELTGGCNEPDILAFLLVEMVLARSDRLDTIHDLLMTDVAEDYPGACRRALEALFASEPHDCSVRERLRSVGDRLDKEDAVYQHARSAPEVVALRPARQAWDAVQNRIFQEAERHTRSSGRFVLQQLVETMSIVRGEGTAPAMPGAEPTMFRSYSRGFVLPRRQALDPLSFLGRRVEHRQKAALLLAGQDDT